MLRASCGRVFSCTRSFPQPVSQIQPRISHSKGLIPLGNLCAAGAPVVSRRRGGCLVKEAADLSAAPCKPGGSPPVLPATASAAASFALKRFVLLGHFSEKCFVSTMSPRLLSRPRFLFQNASIYRRISWETSSLERCRARLLSRSRQYFGNASIYRRISWGTSSLKRCRSRLLSRSRQYSSFGRGISDLNASSRRCCRFSYEGNF